VPLSEHRGPAASRRRWRERGAPKVALIEATGPITVRAGSVLPRTGITSDELCAALRHVAADDDVAAVVLRIDSPGGSAVASDAIRHEILRLRDGGTPVVAWMGDIAGSGGYYIAMPADRIVAQPGTLTGSIGVIAGKAVRTGLEDRLGVSTEAVTRGAHARYYSPATGFSDSERQRLDSQLDRVYADFTAKVAHDRSMPPVRVEQVARGRIWTGAQAMSHGLVDRLGGYHEVLELTRAALGLPPDAPLRVRRHPPRRHLLARLRGGGPDDPAQRDLATAVTTALTDPTAFPRLIDELTPLPGMLTMPWVPRLR
jgi:protease-4